MSEEEKQAFREEFYKFLGNGNEEAIADIKKIMEGVRNFREGPEDDMNEDTGAAFTPEGLRMMYDSLEEDKMDKKDFTDAMLSKEEIDMLMNDGAVADVTDKDVGNANDDGEEISCGYLRKTVNGTIKMIERYAYKKGYAEGKDDALRDTEEQDAYKHGFYDGFKGHVKEWQRGFAEGKQEGMDLAWEAARKIYGFNKDTRAMAMVFTHYETVFDNYTAAEAIEMLAAWEQKQKED